MISDQVANGKRKKENSGLSNQNLHKKEIKRVTVKLILIKI